MDSLTQMTLGAAISAAVAGKTHGGKAVAVGAICGTIPDLDVFILLGDPVSDFTYHRGLSHSILFFIAATPLFVWILSRIKWFEVTVTDKRMYAAVFLIFITHGLLDAMTIYGTQLFFPSTLSPVGIGSVFIIDPLYTLPFLGFLITWLIWKNQKIIYAGLMLSTLYLGWSVAAQSYVHYIARPQIEGRMLVQPTPFNTLLWRVLVMQDNGYKVGYYSLFDNTNQIEFQSFPSTPSLLPNNLSVGRLQWFTKGFYAVHQDGDAIVMTDLRMGLEPDQYVFSFAINQDPPIMMRQNRDMSRLNDVWTRIWRDVDKE